jgi:hypothetical protein
MVENLRLKVKSGFFVFTTEYTGNTEREQFYDKLKGKN